MGRAGAAYRHVSGLPRGDRAIAKLAGVQYGVVSTAQLAALGLSASGVRRRVMAGRLHRVHRGVYSVGHAVLGREGRWLAAVLACGPDAVLSHRDAAALWAIRDSARSSIEVTTCSRGRTSRPGIEVHRVRTLAADDVLRHRGIPVTSVARTLVDLAEVLSTQRLARAVHEAEMRGLFDLREVEAAIERANGRHGVAQLRAVLAAPASGRTRSDLELRFLELVPAGLPEPLINALISTASGRFEVDFFWPDQGVVVETDGAAAHRTRRAFEADRVRDAALVLAGLRVVRFTYRRVIEQPEAVTATLAALLARPG